MTLQSGPSATAQPPFSQRFRERSQLMHRDTGASAYLAALTKGHLDLSGYAALVAQHAVIYRALEELGEQLADDPIAGRFVFPDLYRREWLQADLEYLKSRGLPIPEPTPQTLRYIERLKELATWPGGFIAHHYVRYLGDIAGGQSIGRQVATHYGLVPGGDGVRFYVFDKISPKPFRETYRQLLDETPFDETEQQQVLDEVLVAFRYNIDILTELAEQVLPRYPQVAS
ncbi:heme oxygenase (biliverdin-producing) [Kribbella sp. NPDC056345]|uniref:biliverdin-producing heme oxygenase n=1 Tax=Kribbella sp. NPDC056345 TaxID=3345789 RepID=UPI0035DB711F